MFNILYCNFGRNHGKYLLFQLFVIAKVSDLVKSSSCETDITFIRDDVFSNSRLTEGRIRTHSGVANQATCSVKCDRHTNCKSFFFKRNSGTCQINSLIYLSTAGSVADEGFVYFRKNMVCPAPPSVPNSQPQFDVNSAPNTIGTVLEYTCSVGYTPEGSVNCQVDGTWTQKFCTEDCPSPPDIPNGKQPFVASAVSRSQGTSLQYNCQRGFVPENGLTTITCQVSATWTNIVCKRPDCPSAPAFANSNQLFDPSAVTTVYGTSLQYECKTGFVAENGVTTITCDIDATWTNVVCKRPDCPKPTLFTNSNQLFNPSTVSTAYGETLQYECKSGFVAENGVTTITCDIDATWTSSVVCKRPDCPSPPVIANSNEQFVRSTVSTVFGATLQYGCKSGFVAKNGVTTVTCGLGASWTSIVCKRPDCPSPPVFANSYQQFNPSTVSTAYGEILQYVCSSGYVPANDVTTITCGVGATWTSLVCKRPDCPNPPVISNSNELFVRSTVSTLYRATLQYQCKSGFVAENGVTTVTCGVDATWTSIVCKRPDCPSPPTFANSDQEFNPSTVSTAYGASLQYKCKPGFKAQNGVTSITCQIGATWTTSVVCSLIRSCSEVKACNSQYGDGDYWIYPAPYGTTKAKIYCRNMNNGAIEYVTLNTINVGYKPPVSNMHCGGEESPGCSKGGGETRYEKIRVNIQTMEVDRTDRTFAYTAFGIPRNYGEAADCYSIHYGNIRVACGPKGTFNIDTTGTGLIVDPTLSFPVTGWNAWGQVVRRPGGTQIDLLCGGWSGACRPDKDMLLVIGSTAPSSASAVMPTCS
ncbi:sushi, von Willebrand factor type A, EGF and pentraxin domain-containing protein 1-like [Gigantopelta aegis]|uniref:sushi, von Willebrand factor type A, EGF and pentraxin domain-containing protein 1-like n=1 Tax=Gigantopelta aegis TaxID=1735272 RepID=UPI001B88C875|nr:sushi, von Willebrand factor type A, EGF and pentraxin domain-containing protein 1-like [Gigantopelta aegis]